MFERLFQLKAHGTTVRKEVVAGITTFLTMDYIIVVNPSILSSTGMDFGAVFVATCLAAAAGTLIMGFIANYPIALAPGMGQNAFFTYGIVLGVGHPWQVALQMSGPVREPRRQRQPALAAGAAEVPRLGIRLGLVYSTRPAPGRRVATRLRVCPSRPGSPHPS